MPFREDVAPHALVALEEESLRRWDEEKTFERGLAARRDAPRWVFFEGPPTANGKPGLHHVLARSLKDLACRRKTMQGFLVERKGGWDTHGLPVEIAAEKALGLEGKDAIERYGIAKFNEVCRKTVLAHVADFEAMSRRTGYWLDFRDAYLTCSNPYVESLWSILADWHRRGLLVRGHKVLPYCPRCATPLSSHEVALGYRDVQDPSVFVRFRALAADGSEAPESFLVWTTTPWTLPSNVALAVHPDVDYVKVRLSEGEGKTEVLWLAEPRLGALHAKSGQVEVLERAKGRALVGRRFRRLLDLYDVDAAPNAFTVRAGEFVTTEDGTGIVHMAPAYGEDDAAVGRRDALPTLHPVDGRGRFLPGPRAALVAGAFVKDADREILRHLKQQGALFRQETLVHAYPHCWRCDTPLLYYARDSWYVKTTQFRDRMIEFNKSVRWVPEATGSGRFGQWLENNVDWAFSRDRYWGTPLPIWACDACAREDAVGSLEDLRRRAGPLPEPVDLHRPWVDERTWACAAKGCAGTMRRTPEVADVWFDSGAMPFAQWHWPFENKERVAREVPADFVAEAVDQTRGWFYTLLAVSTLVADRPAYRTCVSTDLILDAKGKKMAKRTGNVVEPMGLMAKYGADVVRWHLLTSRPIWLPMRFDESDLVDVRNRTFGTLASTYAFFALYANADGFVTDAGPDADGRRASSVFDRWILSRLHGLVAAVDADLDGYETSKAGKRIGDFVVEDLSTWYVRRNRRRFWKGALTADKREGYATLRTVLSTVSRLMAPLAPFLPDVVYRALHGGGPDTSVHLAKWPAPDPRHVDLDLEQQMDALRTVVALGHAARAKAGIKVRQPLARVTAGHADAGLLAFLEEHRAVVLDELNVKDLELVRGFEKTARLAAALDKKAAARRLQAKTQAVEAALAGLDGPAVRALAERIALGESAAVKTASGESVDLLPGEVRLSTLDAEGGASEYGAGFLVRLDTGVTPDLRAEGLAREFVHGLQVLRKAKGLAVTDRVKLLWKAPEPLAAAIRAHEPYLAEEVLALAVSRDEALSPSDSDPVGVDGETALVRLSVATR